MQSDVERLQHEITVLSDRMAELRQEIRDMSVDLYGSDERRRPGIAQDLHEIRRIVLNAAAVWRWVRWLLPVLLAAVPGFAAWGASMG